MAKARNKGNPSSAANTGRRIRIRTTQGAATKTALFQTPFETAALSRQEAIRQSVRHLRTACNHPAALSLIALFHLDAEELLEAGASYEAVCALQRQFPLLGSLN